MARGGIITNKNCPFCGKDVQYWPNCCETTNPGYGNVEWVITKRRTKQFFHRTCFEQNTIKKRNVV